MKLDKTVIYRLVEDTELSLTKGGKQTVTWGSCELPPQYTTRDANGTAISKVISIGTTLHPKSGVQMPILINGIQFNDGVLRLRENADKHIIDALDESVNNRDFKNRLWEDKAIFYKVNASAERLKVVDDVDLKVEAALEIDKASPESVLEYAKAIGGIETIEVEAMLSTGKAKKDSTLVKATDEYVLLCKELKAVAYKDAAAFLAGFKDQKRPYLAAINEGLALQVITYSSAEREFSFTLGNSRQTFATCPKGTTEHKNWLAGWFTENEPTFIELLSKIKAANALK